MVEDRDKEYDLDSGDSLRRLRARVRNQSDDITKLRQLASEHKIEIERTKGDVSELRESSVNHYQFDARIEILTQSLASLTKAVEEIRSGVWWGIKLIVGTVGLGLLTLLFRWKDVSLP